MTLLGGVFITGFNARDDAAVKTISKLSGVRGCRHLVAGEAGVLRSVQHLEQLERQPEPPTEQRLLRWLATMRGDVRATARK